MNIRPHTNIIQEEKPHMNLNMIDPFCLMCLLHVGLPDHPNYWEISEFLWSF
jgi:hypothetical protein